MKITIIVALLVVQIALLLFFFWPQGDAFTNEYGKVVDEVVKIVDNDPTKEGVEKARGHFNSNESRLKAIMDKGLMPDRDAVIANKVDQSVREKYRAYTGSVSMRMDDLSKRHPNIKDEVDKLRLAVLRID